MNDAIDITRNRWTAMVSARSRGGSSGATAASACFDCDRPVKTRPCRMPSRQASSSSIPENRANPLSISGAASFHLPRSTRALASRSTLAGVISAADAKSVSSRATRHLLPNRRPITLAAGDLNRSGDRAAELRAQHADPAITGLNDDRGEIDGTELRDVDASFVERQVVASRRRDAIASRLQLLVDDPAVGGDAANVGERGRWTARLQLERYVDGTPGNTQTLKGASDQRDAPIADFARGGVVVVP